jgi:hypothetical protein
MVSYYATIVFFGCYFLNYLLPNGVLGLITAIAAAFVAFGLIVEKYPTNRE